MADEKKTLTHPDYSEGGIINFTKWSREIVPKPEHGYNEGDTLEIQVTLIRKVKSCGFDCDGTPLYWFDDISGGWPEECVKGKVD